jgi:sulfatase modifying factor 1
MRQESSHTHDVFVSHSSKDKTWADAACAVLERHRIRCWIAPRDITPGQEWGAEIIKGIKGSRMMVLIFSGHANSSVQVRREVERAGTRGMTILAMRIEDVQPAGAMEYNLSDRHWLDAFTPPVEKQLEKLARSVTMLLANDVESPAAPAREKAAVVVPAPVVPPTRWAPSKTLIALLSSLFGLIALAVIFVVSPTVPKPEPGPPPAAPHSSSRPNKPPEKQPGDGITARAAGIKFKLIPAGEFLMGSSQDEDKAAEDDEMVNGKKHRVRITRPFYLGQTEVTQGQYVAVTGQNPSRFKGADLPVDQVRWNDAVDFCNALSRAEGLPLFYKVEGLRVEVLDWKGPGYRLPTEAEWEYACRAKTTTRYQSGDDPETLATVGNVADATARAKFRDWTLSIKARDGYLFSAPVGQFRANRFGLFDMHGNVWEWCWDWYKEDYYKESPADDPTGPSIASDRVKRGGSWFYAPLYARSAKRDKDPPVARLNFLGFRIARGQSGSEPANVSSTPSIPDVITTRTAGVKRKLIPAGEFRIGSSKGVKSMSGGAYLSRATPGRFALPCAGRVSRIASVVRTRRRPTAAA